MVNSAAFPVEKEASPIAARLATAAAETDSWRRTGVRIWAGRNLPTAGGKGGSTGEWKFGREAPVGAVAVKSPAGWEGFWGGS
jgi:hypothetical protein